MFHRHCLESTLPLSIVVIILAVIWYFYESVHVHQLALLYLSSQNILLEELFQLTVFVEYFTFGSEVRRLRGGLHSVKFIWNNWNQKVEHCCTHQNCKNNVIEPLYDVANIKFNVWVLTIEDSILQHQVRKEAYALICIPSYWEINQSKTEDCQCNYWQKRYHCYHALQYHLD